MILVVLIIGLLAILRVDYNYVVVSNIIDAVYHYNVHTLYTSSIEDFEKNEINFNDLKCDRYTFNLLKWTPKQYLGDGVYEKLKPFI